MENNTSFYELETDRLVLRKLSLKDTDDMYEYGSDKKVSEYVMWPQYTSKQDGETFAEFVINQHKEGHQHFWAIEIKETSKMIGTINFVGIKEKYNWGELGYVLNQNYWNKGYMTEAIKAVLKHSFESLKLNKVQAKCIKENIASYRAMEKVNMTYEGLLRQHMIKNGQYVDLVCYSILASEYNN